MALGHADFFHMERETQLVQLGQGPKRAKSGPRLVIRESKGMMEVWDRDDVPGAASQRTRLESAEVMDKVGDDHFHDFIRNAAGRFVRGTRAWRPGPE